MPRVAVTPAELRWLRRNRPRWIKRRDVTVSSGPGGFPPASDGALWWEMALNLECNRHCPEFHSDQEVSIALHQLAKARGYEERDE
jgi:hypothetical protein